MSDWLAALIGLVILIFTCWYVMPILFDGDE